MQSKFLSQKFNIAALLKPFIFLVILSNKIFAQDIPVEIQSLLEGEVENEEIEIIEENSLTKNDEIEKSDYFGFDFFNYTSSTNTPVLDIPLFSSYEITFNDKIEILLTGNKSDIYESRVDLSGNIFIENLGSFSLYGLTVEEAQKKISEAVSQRYIETKAFLNIKEASVKKISVIGHVKSPGTYLVNPFTSISESIKYAGGLKDNASLRDIEIIDISGKKTKVDLYKFLINGNRSIDRAIKNGETVRVSASQNYFDLRGAVNRPMKYEFSRGDTIQDILAFGMGPTKNASLDRIAINLVENNEIITKNVSEDFLFENNIESIYIPSYPLNTNLSVQVIGSPVTDGYFSYSIGESLLDFIEKLNFSDEVFRFGFLFSQQQIIDGQLAKTLIVANLNDKMMLSNIRLQKNVKLIFFSLNDILKYSEYILESTIPSNEEIVSKDDLENLNFDFQKKYGLSEEIKDYLESTQLKNFLIADQNLFMPLAGSLQISSLLEAFEIGDIATDQVSVVMRNKYIDNAYSKIISNSEEILSIIAPKKNSNLISIEITGAINYPGTYSVSPDTSLNEIYSIAGGLKSNADPLGIILTKKNLKEKEIRAFKERKKTLVDLIISSQTSGSSVTATPELLNFIDGFEEDDFSGRAKGNLSPGSALAESTILDSLDSIYIPTVSNNIIVTGEVLSPGSFAHAENKKASYYVDLAGGMTKYADKSSILIIKSNGIAIIDSNYILEKGDIISISRNYEKTSPITIVGIVSNVLSNLALAAASINVLNR